MQDVLSLSLEKKIGQLFFIGLPGTEVDSETGRLLDDLSPGGICFFARNIRSAEQTRNFLEEVSQVLIVKPLLSIDEEGGTVDRLRRIITPLPAAALIGSTKEAAILARITDELLRMLGFNMNFAPVVDVIDERRGTSQNGLYSRAFGESKETVVRFAGSYLTALQSGGTLACLKHFPGLGASQIDSHEDLPTVNVSGEELSAVDLFPYRELFKTAAVHAVMVAHAAYPLSDLQETDVNGKLLPSSLSFNIITELLRQKLGFRGLVISDDLEMGAILKNYGIGDACVRAVNAGVDMLSICADPNLMRRGFKAVVEAVEVGSIKENRIDEALTRIARIKSLIAAPLPLDLNRLSNLSREITEFNKKLNNNYGG